VVGPRQLLLLVVVLLLLCPRTILQRCLLHVKLLVLRLRGAR